MSTPNLGLETVPSNSLQPSVPINDDLQLLDMLVQWTPQSFSVTTPPTTVGGDIGKSWIIPAGATGVWSGKTNQIALCTAAGVWRYTVPKIGWSGWNLATSAVIRYNGTTWS